MRISRNKDDAGYPQFCVAQANGKKIFAFLDDVKVNECIVADEELGFVERCVLDLNGHIQVDPVDANLIWTERVPGRVEVKFE